MSWHIIVSCVALFLTGIVVGRIKSEAFNVVAIFVMAGGAQWLCFPHLKNISHQFIVFIVAIVTLFILGRIAANRVRWPGKWRFKATV